MTRNHRRVLKLMEKDPHCYWCGVEVIHPYPPPAILPSNYATIDHLYSRVKLVERLKAMLIGKERQDGSGVYYVLACFKCNDNRGRKRE